MSLHSEKQSIAAAEWVADRLPEFESDDPDLRLLEVDMEPDAYAEEHVPGAACLDWEAEIAGELGRDLVDREAFEELMGDFGVTEDTTVVLYGDQANWFAAHAFWVMRYYGHEDVMLLDGGRHHWLWEDYPTSTAEPAFSKRDYEASDPDDSIRAYRDEVMASVETDAPVIDVRNPQEYRGEKPPADIANTTEREGHVPGADNIPWGEAVNADGTFKSEAELREIYEPATENSEETAVAYCRIGERSSLTWFVLNELLGLSAANYDGSWTEWGNREDTPVETGSPSSGTVEGGD